MKISLSVLNEAFSVIFGPDNPPVHFIHFASTSFFNNWPISIFSSVVLSCFEKELTRIMFKRRKEFWSSGQVGEIIRPFLSDIVPPHGGGSLGKQF